MNPTAVDRGATPGLVVQFTMGAEGGCARQVRAAIITAIESPDCAWLRVLAPCGPVSGGDLSVLAPFSDAIAGTDEAQETWTFMPWKDLR